MGRIGPFSKEIRVGDKLISKNTPAFIIAEAGVNHGGDFDLAKKLIDIAVEAEADAVKFQTFKANNLILENVEKAPYQKKTTTKTESQYSMLKKLEVTLEQNVKLNSYCKSNKIIFLTTPFEEESLDEIDQIDIPAYKIASTDTTNIPFLKKVAKKGKPIFLSTGMTYLSEINKVLNELIVLNKEIVLLSCTANYPIKDNEANLNIINTFKDNYDMLIGYSDHSVGIGAAPYSIPMGVKVIEKHFTTSKNLKGPDHLASLDPNELKNLVVTIRKIEEYLGSSEKIPTTSELGTRLSLQKSFVALTDIKKGEIFSEKNTIAKRTGGIGISPLYYETVFGSSAIKEFSKNEIISL